MRLVLDTNTVVSGLVWGGVPGQLIESAVASKVHLITSLPLLDELQAVLFRKKFAGLFAAQETNAGTLFEGYAALVQLVVPAEIGPIILADPDDDRFVQRRGPIIQHDGLVFHNRKLHGVADAHVAGQPIGGIF